MHISRYLGATILASALLAGPLFAAEVAAAAAPTDAAAPADEAIVVTGSRLNNPNLQSTVPIVSLSASEVFAQGTISVGDTLNQLPQFRSTFSQANSGNFIGTAGINALDLRGQGTARTLVLVDGRRLITATPGINRPDVNLVPNELLEGIDVLTGGASSIYGSDAVAGVVNFKLLQNFDGIKLRAQGGVSSRSDAGNYLGAITIGHNFANGRGNIAVSAEFTQQNTLYNSERDNQLGSFSGTPGFAANENTGPNLNPSAGPLKDAQAATGDGIPDTIFRTGLRFNAISTGGLFTATCPVVTRMTNETDASFNARLAAIAGRRAVACSGLPNPASSNALAQFGNTFVFNPDGTLVPSGCTLDLRPFGSSSCVGGLSSTLRETGIILPGTVRRSIDLVGHYEFSRAFVPYIRAQYAKVTSNEEGQPTFFNNTFQLTNPFLTDQARSMLTALLAPGSTQFSAFRFNTDFAGRGEFHDRQNTQVTVGARGTFFDTWNYDVSFNYGHLDTFYKTAGNVIRSKYANSIDATRNAAGQIVCRINAVTVTDAACVPVNLFGYGAVSQAALGYFGYTSTRVQKADLYDGIASINGDLGKLFTLPGGPIAFSIGGEIRRETAFAAYDPITASSDPVTGVSTTFLNNIPNFAPPAEVVKEGFFEIGIPLLKDLPFVKDLSAKLSGRVSNYNIGKTGTVYTYNAGGTYAPVSDLRFRADYARSVRAPTQSDLYASLSQNFLNGLVDPCGQQNIKNNPNRVANCAAAGVPTTQTFTVDGVPSTEPFSNRSNAGISGFNGSNPNLQAEVSNSLNIGGVLTPRWVPGLSIEVDYYRIEIKNVINSLGAQTIINQCYDSTTGINNPFCAAIFRNPNGTFAGQSTVSHAGKDIPLTTSGPSFISGPFNYARQLTSGIDVNAAYNHRFNQDLTIGLRADTTYTFVRNNFTNIQDPAFAIRQLSTLGDPAFDAVVSANVITGMFNFGYRFRYIDKQTIGAYATQNTFQGRPATQPEAFPFIYYPIVTYHDLRVDISPPQSHYRFYLGVNNIADKLPPLGLTGTETGDPFSPVGRSFYAGAEVRF